MSGKTDFPERKVYNGWAEKMARETRPKVCIYFWLPRNTFILILRDPGTRFDWNKKRGGKRREEKKERNVSFHEAERYLAVWQRIQSILREGLAIFPLRPFILPSLLSTAALKSLNENTVEEARFAESFALSWFRGRAEY